MPIRLYSYILKDVLKLMALSLAVLLVVVSVGASIKPLIDGLLSPLALFKFILLTMPTMLQFALPYSAAFASTLVYSRMTADNEIVACAAGGISYLSLLMPLLMLGLVLAIGLFFLSNWMIPLVYKSASQMIERDAVKVLVQQLEQGRSFRHRDIVIYADQAWEGKPTPQMIDRMGEDRAPDRVIIMQGVAVSKTDRKTSRQSSEFFAKRAEAFLYKLRDESWVTLNLMGVISIDPDANIHLSVDDTSLQFPLPRPIQGDTRFLTFDELRLLSQEVDLYDKVHRRKTELAEAIAAESMLRIIETELQTRETGAAGRAKLVDTSSATHYEITSPQFTRQDKRINLAGTDDRPVQVQFSRDGLIRGFYQARAGVIKVDSTPLHPEPRAMVELVEVRAYSAESADSPILAEKKATTLPPLRFPQRKSSYETFANRTSPELLELARDEKYGQTPDVRKAYNALAGRMRKLIRSILGRIHGRAASAFSCLLVLVLGAVLSMKMRGAMPLTVYFLAFMLCTLSVALVHSGHSVLYRLDSRIGAGVLVVWSSNITLLTILGVTYWRLCRN
ncbi:MAG: LptF/LptG family permease [Phycisphaeraceae bacterium]|nr:LptF/LptG family permease [Phycisphaeraceae bacterium]